MPYMSHMSKLSLCAVFLLMLSSCEKEIKVSLPEQSNVLVLDAQVRCGMPITVYLGHSESIMKFRPDKNISLKDAIVCLFEDGMAADTLTYDALSGMYVSDIVAAPGRQYKLQAQSPGYGIAEANALAQVPVKILSAKRNFNVRTDEYGSMQDEIVLEFDDPIGRDFYLAKIWLPADTYDMEFCLPTTDPSVEDIYGEDISGSVCVSSKAIFIKDALFDGRRKQLRLFVPGGNLRTDTVMGVPVYPAISLAHVSEDHYKYEKTYRFGAANLGNPFAEPINVHGNVSGGYGIFAIYGADSSEIK